MPSNRSLRAVYSNICLLYTSYTAAVLSAILAAPLTYFILDGHMGVYVAILCGLIGGDVYKRQMFT